MTALEFPFSPAEIRRAAASVRLRGVELDDLASETTVALLERFSRRPAAVAANRGRALRFASIDALRRLTGPAGSIQRRTDALDWVDVAALPAEPEIDEDEATREQRAEWRSLPTSERIRRIAEAAAALGTSHELTPKSREWWSSRQAKIAAGGKAVGRNFEG